MKPMRAALRYGPDVQSRVTGIPRVTLRSWRKRYGFPAAAQEAGDSRAQKLTLGGLAALKVFALLYERGVPGDVAAQAAFGFREKADRAVGRNMPVPQMMVLAFRAMSTGAEDVTVEFVGRGGLQAPVTKAARTHLMAMVVDLQEVVETVERGFDRLPKTMGPLVRAAAKS